jgi:hypothetical protein
MSLVRAEYLNDYKLSLTFSDGTNKTIDFQQKLEAHAIYKPYLKMKNFLKFKVDHGALRWPGNVLDFHYTQLLKM